MVLRHGGGVEGRDLRSLGNLVGLRARVLRPSLVGEEVPRLRLVRRNGRHDELGCHGEISRAKGSNNGTCLSRCRSKLLPTSLVARSGSSGLVGGGNGETPTPFSNSWLVVVVVSVLAADWLRPSNRSMLSLRLWVELEQEQEQRTVRGCRRESRGHSQKSQGGQQRREGSWFFRGRAIGCADPSEAGCSRCTTALADKGVGYLGAAIGGVHTQTTADRWRRLWGQWSSGWRLRVKTQKPTA